MTKVELVIGAFSGVEVDALQFALDMLRPGSQLADTEFVFHQPLLLLFCNLCQNEYVVTCENLVCPACQKAEFEVRQGREMLVKTIHGEKCD